jgi:hypothetical protein
MRFGTVSLVVLGVLAATGCSTYERAAETSSTAKPQTKAASPRPMNHAVVRHIAVDASVEFGAVKVLYVLEGRRDKTRPHAPEPIRPAPLLCFADGEPATSWSIPAMAADEQVAVEGRGRSADQQVLPGWHLDGATTGSGVETWSVDVGTEAEEYHLKASLTMTAADIPGKCEFRLRGRVTGIVR